MYEFDWDPAKAASNVRKHKVRFEVAATVFRDRFAKSIPDEEHSILEERWITIGYAEDERLLVVSHTWTEIDGETQVRIISAWPASRNERREYDSEE